MLTKTKLPAEKRLELVHVSLMREKRFALFAGLFMVGKTSIVDLPHFTAGTNGRDAMYGREFVDSLTDKELAFLVMHENMHKAYRHLTTWKALNEINRDLANCACDFVINGQLIEMDPKEDFIAMPRDKQTNKLMGCHDKKYDGMDTKQVFDILIEEEKQKPKRKRGVIGVPCDNPNNGNGDENGDGNNPDDKGNSKPTAGLDHHDWDNANALSSEEKKQLERDIEQALRQGGIYAGKTGGNIPHQIGKLLKPQVDWREHLRRFVKTNLKERESVSWRKLHKNYLWQDVLLPSVIGKRVKHLVIAMDTSGSTFGPLLDKFLSEMNALCSDIKATRIDIVYWDAKVTAHETYKGGDKDVVKKTNPTGGGGTDPDVVVDFMLEHKLKPDALIMLTDGHMHSNPAKWAAITMPTLWCVIGNESYKVPNGQRLFIKD